MNMKVFDLIETIFNALGILIAVQDIYNWLGILLLVINIFSIIFRGGLEIYRHIKNKDYDKINDFARCDAQNVSHQQAGIFAEVPTL